MQDAFCCIPATTLPSGLVIPGFELGQYLCSRGPENKIAVCANNEPIRQLGYFEAREACHRAGFRLLTIRQMIAIVYRASTWPSNYECHNDNPWLQLTADSGASFPAHFGQWLFDDVAGSANGMAAGKDSEVYTKAIGHGNDWELPLDYDMGGRARGHESLQLFAQSWRHGFAGGYLCFRLDVAQLGDSQRGFRCTR